MHKPYFLLWETEELLLIWNVRKGLSPLSVDICSTGWWVSSLHTRAGFILMLEWALQLPDIKLTLKRTETHIILMCFNCVVQVSVHLLVWMGVGVSIQTPVTALYIRPLEHTARQVLCCATCNTWSHFGVPLLVLAWRIIDKMFQSQT